MPDIKFRLKRQDPQSKKNPEVRWEEYTVTYEGENLTVLEGLFYIQEKVTVSPMPHLPLVKDMVCNMDEFFAKYEYIMPWLIRNSPDPEKEINQSPKQRKKLDMPVDCILCGCCYSSCPSAWGEDNYLGPAALLKAYRFEVDTRDEARKERLPRFDNERGVYRCHTIMNCVEACPKELNPTEGIQGLKRTAVRRRLFGKLK
jgi:succinate dehydrogenase / fumarate reductase iron-sulfur subunit